MATEPPDQNNAPPNDPPPGPEFSGNNTNGDGEGGGGNDEVIGSAAIRPVFLGNLRTNYTPEDVIAIFERPMVPPNVTERNYRPVPVDRIDLKRGYCFVFLKDATRESDKENAERLVSDINGMQVPNVSIALRAEFARGDGRIKRKEDERRKQIAASETLFVVNFHEETTRREDLQMLFEPFGELVRIDMKRNYAFVQFRTVDEARRAKEVTNGGKLDQSVLTVEYVARQRGDRYDRGGGGDRSNWGGDRRMGGGDRRDVGRRYDDRRGPPPGRGPPPPYYQDRYRDDRRGGGGGGRDDRYDDFRRRERSPPPPSRRPRSRSRSPRYSRRSSRSPPGRDRRYDDRGGGDRYDDFRDRRPHSPPDGYRDRGGGRSPDRDYSRGDRDRGYRP